MRKIRALLGVVAALLTAGASNPAASIERIEKGLRAPVLVEGDKTWTLEERMRLFHVPGLSVAVFRDFQIAWAKAYGFAEEAAGQRATDATLFQAGSVSKPVAAMGALKLVEEGKLSLDKDVNTYLKGWKIPENDLTRKTPVTLEMLLSHTGGLTVHGFGGYAADQKVPTLIEVLEGTPPANSPAIRVDLAPGTQYRYSGGGYTIAQLAMLDVTGETFPKLLAATVLKPLGMTQSTYDQPLPEALVGKAAAGYYEDGKVVPGKRHVYPEMAAAGLWATPSDLARFGIGLQNILRGKPGPISRAMAERMITGVRDGYGLGLAVADRDGAYFSHDGADEGFQTLFIAHKTKGYGVAIMANSDAGFKVMPELLRAIGAEYGWEGFPEAPVRLAQLSPAQLAAVAGRYRLGTDQVLVVAPKGEVLECRVTFQEPFELLPVSAIAFVRRDDETRYILSNGWVRIDPRGEPGKESPRMTAKARVPAEDLEAGRVDDAVAAYRKLRDANPADPAVAEQRFNNVGYTLLRKKEFAKAIAILQLNAELYPASSNTYDSLAEAYMTSGDKEKAVAFYTRSLAVIDADPKTTAEQKAALKTNGVAKLKELGATP
jgi:CubicO group peptidase (beta-lactamase class C family)